MSILVREALFEPVRKCRAATHFKQVKPGVGYAPKKGAGNSLQQSQQQPFYWTPCSPGDPDPTKKEMTLLDVPGPQLMAPHSTMRDFQNALENVRPSVGPDDLKQQEEFSRRVMNSRIWKPTKPWTCAPVMFPRKSRSLRD